MAIEKPIFCLPSDLGTIAAGNERANMPAIHLGNFRSPGLVWRSNGNSNLWVRGQFAAAKAVSMMSLMAANAQAGTKIRLRLGTSQAQVDGTAPYDSGAVDFISPAETTDEGLYHAFVQFAAVSATWWRIDISGHTGDFEACALVLGSALQSGRFYDRGWELGTEDLGDIELSRWAVANETDGLVLRRISFNLSWVSEAQFKSGFRPLMMQTRRKPVFLLFNPENVVGRQSQFYFGRFSQAPFATSSRKPGHYAMEFSMVSMI